MAKKFLHDVLNHLLGSGNTTEILKNKQTESRSINEPKKRGRKKTTFNSEQEIKITFTVYKAQIETIRAFAY